MAAKAMLNLIWPDAAALLQPINKHSQPATLQKFIRKSRFKADVKDYHALVLANFGQPDCADLPLAALRFPEQTALCADLCYLHADRDCLRLFHRDLKVTEAESASLQQHLAPLLDDFQGEWLTHSAKHWGLRLPTLPDIQWHSVNALEGQSISDKLPIGSGQSQWWRLINELQMALYEHPVNQQREADGLLPINSIWFSGAAKLSLHANWREVAGDDDLLKPLAEMTGAHWQSSVDTLLNSKPNGNTFAVLPAFDIDADWSTQLSSLEQQIFQPLWRQLRRWQLSEINLCVPNYGRYHLNAWRSWL